MHAEGDKTLVLASVEKIKKYNNLIKINLSGRLSVSPHTNDQTKTFSAFGDKIRAAALLA